MNFPCHAHQICLVSEQTMPNYLGSIVPGALPKQVHLVVTDRMKERASILEKALRLRGYGVEQYHIAASRPDAMIDVLDRIYAKTGSDVSINVTGGTKIMALTTVEWASIQDTPPFLFYVDTDNGKFLQIGGKLEQFEISAAIKLKELLRVGAGVDIIKQEDDSLNAWERDYLEQLVQPFLKNRTALELFNKCAKEAEGSLYADIPFGNLPEFACALAVAQKAGKLHLVSDKIAYKSESARFWCNGGWLEDFVRARLYKMKRSGLIDDWASNIQISRGQKVESRTSRQTPSPLNELDAAFTASNRFFVIECKTANLARRDGFSNASYKLDSLRRSLGGIFSHGMIVSVHDPRPEDIQRCRDLRIKLLYGSDVLKLEEKLKNWIQNANR